MLKVSHLDLLSTLLFVDARTADARSTLLFLQAKAILFIGAADGPMVCFFEDGIGLHSLEFGFKVTKAAVGAAVGAATSVGEVVPIILGLITGVSPRRLC